MSTPTSGPFGSPEWHAAAVKQMNPPTATPSPSRLWLYFQETHGMVLTASEESDIRHAANAAAESDIRTLETELACEKANRNLLIEKGAKLETELARLRAENSTLRAAQKACEACDEPTAFEVRQLRAEVERLLGENVKLNGYADMHMKEKARAERAEAALTEAIDGVIDGGSIPDTLLVIHVPRSPVGYRVGQPVKVILPTIDAAMKGTT